MQATLSSPLSFKPTRYTWYPPLRKKPATSLPPYGSCYRLKEVPDPDDSISSTVTLLCLCLYALSIVANAIIIVVFMKKPVNKFSLFWYFRLLALLELCHCILYVQLNSMHLLDNQETEMTQTIRLYIAPVAQAFLHARHMCAAWAGLLYFTGGLLSDNNRKKIWTTAVTVGVFGATFLTCLAIECSLKYNALRVVTCYTYGREIGQARVDIFLQDSAATWYKPVVTIFTEYVLFTWGTLITCLISFISCTIIRACTIQQRYSAIYMPANHPLKNFEPGQLSLVIAVIVGMYTTHALLQLVCSSFQLFYRHDITNSLSTYIAITEVLQALQGITSLTLYTVVLLPFRTTAYKLFKATNGNKCCKRPNRN